MDARRYDEITRLVLRSAPTARTRGVIADLTALVDKWLTLEYARGFGEGQADIDGRSEGGGGRA